MIYNEILLSGEVNNIIINNRYITLGLTCKKYSPNENSNIVYASLRVYKDLYENNKGLFLLGKRCESVPLTDEELAELEELLKPYKDGDSSE